MAIVLESGIRIHSFQEARGISGMKGLNNKVGYRAVLRVAAKSWLINKSR